MATSNSFQSPSALPVQDISTIQASFPIIAFLVPLAETEEAKHMAFIQDDDQRLETLLNKRAPAI